MSIEHKYCYLLNGVYLITDRPRPEYKQVTPPFNIFKDILKILVGYVRWSDRGQTLGHSLEMQEKEIITRAKMEGYQIVVLFIDEATSAYHIPAQKRSVMIAMKNFILSNQNICGAIFYEESRITRLIEDFALYILDQLNRAGQISSYSLLKSKENGMKITLMYKQDFPMHMRKLLANLKEAMIFIKV